MGRTPGTSGDGTLPVNELCPCAAAGDATEAGAGEELVVVLEPEFPEGATTGPAGIWAERGFLAAGEKIVRIRTTAANRYFTGSPPIPFYL